MSSSNNGSNSSKSTSCDDQFQNTNQGKYKTLKGSTTNSLSDYFNFRKPFDYREKTIEGYRYCGTQAVSPKESLPLSIPVLDSPLDFSNQITNSKRHSISTSDRSSLNSERKDYLPVLYDTVPGPLQLAVSRRNDYVFLGSSGNESKEKENKFVIDVEGKSSIVSHGHGLHRKLNQNLKAIQTSKLINFKDIKDYSDVSPIRALNPKGISLFRGTDIKTQKSVILKMSLRTKLSTVSNVRYEWDLLTKYNQITENSLESSKPYQYNAGSASYSFILNDETFTEPLNFPRIPLRVKGILRPIKIANITNESPLNIALVYDNSKGLLTLEERFLPQYDEKAFIRTNEEVITIISVIVRILETLKVIHHKGFTHNCISSSTVFIDIENETYISSWDLSFSLSSGEPLFNYMYDNRKEMKKDFKNLLCYTSPESTGEINSLVDYRSDFYSLGTVLYELLVGKLPFNDSDKNSLFQKLISEKPLPPIEDAPWISPALNDLMMILLKKDPSDRYQSAEGLIYDLLEIKYTLVTTCSIFNIGTGERNYPVLSSTLNLQSFNKNFSARFIIPNHLFGRQKELKQLTEAHDKSIKSGGVHAIIVSGESGSGTTKLVSELRKSAVSVKGLVAFANLSPYSLQRISPFSNIANILRVVISQILSGSPKSISRWKDYISMNSYADFSILFDSIPDLKLLLGQSYIDLLPNLPREGPLKQRLRYQHALKILFSLLGSSTSLTIIWDNIQWYSPTPLKELFNLINDLGVETTNITFVLTYLTDKGCPDDYLSSLELLQVPKVIIELNPFSSEKITEFIYSALYDKDLYQNKKNSDEAAYKINGNLSKTIPNFQLSLQVESLSQIIYENAKGNPLLMKTIMRYLFEQGILKYCVYSSKIQNSNPNYDKCGYNYNWIIDFEKLKMVNLPNSADGYVLHFLKLLPKDYVEILKICSCFDEDIFSLFLIECVCGYSPQTIASAIHFAIELKLLAPTSEYYKYPFWDIEEIFEKNPEEYEILTRMAKFRFFHVEVKNVIRESILEEDKMQIHNKVGMNLLNSEKIWGTIKVIDGVSAVASHFSKSWTIAKPEEYEKYIKVLKKAGKHALEANFNYNEANMYYDIVRKMLKDEEELFETRLSLLKLQYLQMNYKETLRLADEYIDSVDCKIKKAKFLVIKVRSLYATEETKSATEFALIALNLLGVNAKDDVEWNLVQIQKLSPRMPVAIPEIREFIQFSKINDERIELIQNFIAIIITKLTLAKKRYLLEYLTFTAVTYMLDYGINSTCGFALVYLAMTFLNEKEDSSTIRAYEYCKLITTVVESDNIVWVNFTLTVYEYYAMTVGVFFEPLPDIQKYITIIASPPRRTMLNDVSFKFDNFFGVRAIYKYLTGKSLASMADYFRSLNYYLYQDQNELLSKDTRTFVSYTLYVFESLITAVPMDSQLQKRFDEHFSFERSDYDSQMYIIWYYLLKLSMSRMFGDTKTAMDIVTNILPDIYKDFPHIVFSVPIAFFGTSLLTLHQCDKDLNTYSYELLTMWYNDLHRWSKTCPATFYHKYLFFKAEMSAGNENDLVVLDIYQTSSLLALQNGFIHEAAEINERSSIWLYKTAPFQSLENLNYSIELYKEWGSTIKVEELQSFANSFMRYNSTIHKFESNFTTMEAMIRNITNKDNMDGTTISDPFSTPIASYSGYGALNDGPSVGQGVSPLRFVLRDLALLSETSCDKRDSMRSKSCSNSFSSNTSNTSSMDLLTYTNENLLSPTANSNKPRNFSEGELGRILKSCLDISESINFKSIVQKLMESVLSISGADYCVFVSLENEELFIDAVGVFNNIKSVQHEPLSSLPHLCPESLIRRIAETGESISRNKNNFKFDTIHCKDPYYDRKFCHSVLGVPIISQVQTVGVLYLENTHLSHVFSSRINCIIDLFCTQAAMSIDKSRLYYQMGLAKKAAEEATVEKANFLANMSHEIRTPFNALLSCSLFLLETNLSDIQKEYVETIRASSKLTLSIIDDILTFSKFEKGTIEIENLPFSFNKCIGSSIKFLAEQATSKGLEFVHFNYSHDLDLIYGDANKLRQVIINLVGNSVKFTNKGHITITTRAKRVSSDHRYELVVAVEDTGIGIPPGSHNKVFKAFSQVNGTLRREFGGSGLGLAISKTFVELMGGHLTFESVEGEGTTFQFSLIAKGQDIKQTNANIFKNKNALLFDNKKLSSESLKNDLETIGFKVDYYPNFNGSNFITNDIIRDYNLVFIENGVLTEKLDDSQQEELSKLSISSKTIIMNDFGTKIKNDHCKTDHNININSRLLFRPYQLAKLVDIISKCLQGLETDHNQEESRSSIGSNDSNEAMTTPMVTDTEREKKKSISEEIEREKRRISDTNPLKILLAEDNMINTKVALQHLKRMGYEAHHAKDGIEVLEMCEKEYNSGNGMYDCILMDIQMPRKDGITTTIELEQIYDELTRPNVIALTANAVGEDRERCLAAGMTDYVPKPILPKDLSSVLQSIIPICRRKKLAGCN